MLIINKFVGYEYKIVFIFFFKGINEWVIE